jgi:hypothetical protein
MIEQASRARSQACELHRTCGLSRCRTMWRGGRPSREMPHDRQPSQDQDRDHQQTWWPWAGYTVLAVNLRIIDDQHRLSPPSHLG